MRCPHVCLSLHLSLYQVSPFRGAFLTIPLPSAELSNSLSQLPLHPLD